jgi:hypothetical protein
MIRTAGGPNKTLGLANALKMSNIEYFSAGIVALYRGENQGTRPETDTLRGLSHLRRSGRGSL